MTVKRTVEQFSGYEYTLQRTVVTFEKLFFELCFCDLNLYCFVDLLIMTLRMIGIVFDRSWKKRVDERSLAQTRLASNLQL